MFHFILHAAVIDATLYILLIFSVITWTLIIFKAWQIAKNKKWNRHFGESFWTLSNLQQASTLPETTARGPYSRIVKQGLDWLQESRQATTKSLKFCGTPHDLLEQTLFVQLQKEQHDMESGLTMLASIGSTAPFVGLFGTVLGIMNAMHDITESGSSSIDVVAGPIGDALVATAIGIAVAVPAVLAYNFFLRRVKLLRIDLENFVASFMHAALGEKN